MESTLAKLEAFKDFHFIAAACYKFSRALLGKEPLATAFLGSSIFYKMEILQDCGFHIINEKKAFFGNNCPNRFNIFCPLSEFDPKKFDVALISEKNPEKNKEIKEYLKNHPHCLFFDLEEFADYFQKSLNSIQRENFLSCLNISKLTSIALLTYLCPAAQNIAEIGAYECGTTIFMAKMIQLMKKRSKILTFDTFCGIPAPSEKDKASIFCFNEGMFCDSNLEKVKTRLLNENTLDQISLYPGKIQDTLHKVIDKNSDLFFAFVDTDQYLGTKEGMIQALKVLPKKRVLIVLGDTLVGGVNTAIEEILEQHKELKREKLFTNFELVLSKAFDTSIFYN